MFRKIMMPLFLGLWMPTLSLAQNFSQSEILQGYAERESTTWFIFDPGLYDVAPSHVAVTGAFRGWDQDMSNTNWVLKKADHLWLLSVSNADRTVIPVACPFKFRIDDGRWLDPPGGAPNVEGGNLVFLYGETPPSLKAEITREGTIWAYIGGIDRSLNPASFRLTDSKGTQIPVTGVLPNTVEATLLTTAEPLDHRRFYFLEIPASKLKATVTFDHWFRSLYSSKALGANIADDGSSTTFRMFSPRATGMKLYLYEKPDQKKAGEVHEMVIDPDGVWEVTIPKNLNGVYYDFTVHGFDEPGNHFYESDPVHISDPYARVSLDTWGKCRVWPKTKPATPLANGVPPLEDVIAYEVHVQDFTDRLPVGKELQGTLPAMTVPGLKNSKGESIGFDYLLDLGINTVHLMPVQEFMHHDDADWKASFENDEYMIAQGISEENYQWGYRTSHAFAIEHRFRKRGTEPGDQREQFRDLVQAFHDKGIAVIIDIVPNHTAENMDGDWIMHFNALGMHYYYRTKDLKHIGAYGNEVKTENRPMTQRWVIDQCLHFIDEFGIDGFRIDLAGQIDRQTLIALKEAIGHDKILYGEPWIASNDPDYENNPSWDWYKHNSPITFFQDDARNAFKGPVFVLENKATDRGWAGGKANERENVKKALINHHTDDKTPLSGINYLDIHDNWALADRFAATNFDGRFGVDEDHFKIAATLLYTSLGPIVTHGGTEMMRSKGAAPLGEVVKTTKAGIKVYLHGNRDTYNHRTANQFVWENVGRSASEKGFHANYKEMHAFWRGLNKFRLSERGKVFRQAERVDESYYQWIEPVSESLLGYIVDEQVLVLLNAGQETGNFEFNLPEGEWKLIGNNQAINHKKGIRTKEKTATLKGGKTHSINLDGTNLRIWLKQ
ncbi:MAG: alpha-amylase family glycosyl hydrolase [Bacteroidota bacterium]